jgi:hypothetical protein
MAKTRKPVVLKKQEKAAARPGRNPPKEYQFKKGTSGSKKGRPPGSKNLKTIVMEAADNQVAATINGKSRKISTLQATVV